jgi:hypothetical protein
LAPDGRPLHIGLLHQYRLGTSGSGLYLSRVANQLLSRGHELSLLTHDDAPWGSIPGCGRPVTGEVQSRCHAYDLRSARDVRRLPPGRGAREPLFRDLTDDELCSYLDRHVELVSAAVRDGGIDVLHVNAEVPMSWVAAAVARRTGVPYVPACGHRCAGRQLRRPMTSGPRR